MTHRASGRGLLYEIKTIWLDRGYDPGVIQKRLAGRSITDAVTAKKCKRSSNQIKANGASLSGEEG